MRKVNINYIKIVFPIMLIISMLFVSCDKTGGKRNNTGTPNGIESEGTSSRKNNDSTPNGINSERTPDETNNNENTTDRNDQTTKPEKSTGRKTGVKALYLTGWTVGSDAKVQHYINLANSTEINSYVVDIKDDDGYLGYESSVADVKEIKSWKPKYDVDKVLKAFHDNNIHVIGRIVCFKDPVYSAAKKEYAIKTVNGGLWRDRNNLTWINPYKRESWRYLTNISKEALNKGFDEIQFDYVRFANDGDKKSMDFGSISEKKHEAIEEFLLYARKEMPNAVLSADVFGIICESPEDTEGIGQYLERIGRNIDYISPMVYPSHYAPGQIVNKVKFLKPDLKPYEVVYNSLVKAKQRIEAVNDYMADVRPYLQDFTATWLPPGSYQNYGPDEVRQQIKAVYDSGYKEWILWDAKNTYDEAAFLPD